VASSGGLKALRETSLCASGTCAACSTAAGRRCDSCPTCPESPEFIGAASTL
jgi:hypothetical protein